MKQFCSNQFALSIAGLFFSRLHSPCECRQIKRSSFETEKKTWVVNGSWKLKAHGEEGKTTAHFFIHVDPNWLRVPPIVRVYERFMRDGLDWHRYLDGGLCYVLKEEWSDRLGRVFENTKCDVDYTMDYATTWLLAATDSLVVRHLIGHRLGLEGWPNEWLAYSHCNSGVEEYLREKLQKKF